MATDHISESEPARRLIDAGFGRDQGNTILKIFEFLRKIDPSRERAQVFEVHARLSRASTRSRYVLFGVIIVVSLVFGAMAYDVLKSTSVRFDTLNTRIESVAGRVEETQATVEKPDG